MAFSPSESSTTDCLTCRYAVVPKFMEINTNSRLYFVYCISVGGRPANRLQ